ncbi:MAG: hypothetical protein UX31_C0003G0010 [Candidatus Nomurabacteria bacterium GW2011_GWA1_46_11]|uniref:Uncharacterized protein n=1 Tax=Candidatus Nomurabacteria bacterium GW2011_GWA1_46_11 TaxID=1618732 RepID=A0A0G1NNW5_9BACT|nr:MAG: hypothetical protein UW69_C0071G0001 [Microgenomates group bacterium GW2011_GWA2_44_7]KKT78286.1 MAG: hypothetical protein UW73_C0004G0010 [Microgenomates group bacterium GW2011_GWB1_44_8]KKU22344.1 MAG: hypothetical protein UX31_C0003G0010 [Candidatus Nomurabacteria bacterium GW2011_GWA1_46_11]
MGGIKTKFDLDSPTVLTDEERFQVAKRILGLGEAELSRTDKLAAFTALGFTHELAWTLVYRIVDPEALDSCLEYFLGRRKQERK